jgi:hypothetical protein
MISTHFRVPHQPNREQLHRLSVLAGYGGYLIQHAAPVTSVKTPHEIIKDCCARFAKLA